MGNKINFKFEKPVSQIMEETSGGDQAQLFLANESRKLMQPYVPERNHILVKNVRTYVEDHRGIVHYLQPYARFQYGGKLMVSSKTGSPWSRGEAKIMTDRDLRYTKPTATSNWDRAMKTARGDDLAKACQNFIKLKRG